MVMSKVFWRHGDEFGVGTLVLSYASPSLNHKKLNIVRPLTPTKIDKLDGVNLNRTVLESEIYTAANAKPYLDDCILANWIYELTPTLEGELKGLNNLVKIKDLNEIQDLSDQYTGLGTTTSTTTPTNFTTITANTLSTLANMNWNVPKKIKPPSNSR
jgi:hypothetical protein